MPTRPAATPPPAPSDETVRELLGPEIHALYDALLRAGPFRPEWKYYGPRNGWSLKLFEKKHNLCFIQPGDGSFRVSFLLGDAATDAVLAGPSCEPVKQALRDARRYVEGRGVSVNVVEEADLRQVMILLQLKRQKR